MVTKSCEECGKIFKKTSNLSKKFFYEKRKFCSNPCRWKASSRIERKHNIEKCSECGNEFRQPPCSKNKFCSRKCFNDSKLKNKKRICDFCGDTFYPFRSSKAKFCSKECFYGRCADGTWNKFSEENAAHWKGGRIQSDKGYIYIRSIGHPRCHCGGYVPESVLVAEKKLGRFLVGTETIHHINEIKYDNRPENLYLFKSNNEHSAYHMRLRRGQVERIKNSNLG